MWNRLYLKLAASLVLIFVLVGALVLWLMGHAMDRYSQAVTQRLNAAVAMYVSDELQLISHGAPNGQALKQLAHHAMIINPSIEVYLLDPAGRILGHALPAQQVLRQRVDLGPVRAFLRPQPALPILGDDPLSLQGGKVFSAHEVQANGRLEGYVYVVLQSQKQALVEQTVLHHQVFRVSALVLVGALMFGLLAALLIFFRLTHRLRRLARQTDWLFRDDDVPVVPVPGDEIAQLETAVDAMQQRIQRQMAQIQQADNQRRELIANISHDLRTPLTNMLGYIETLLLKQGQLSDAQQHQYLTITRNHGRRLGRLVADLFELAKLDSHGVQPHMEAFSLAELAQDVVQDFSMRAQQLGVALDIRGDLACAQVCADIQLIERVLENLLDNALRHTPRGGKVVIRIERQAHGVRCAVSDTGAGIASADMPFVFDRFFHVRDNRQNTLTSTGLGLAIVKRILELHLSPIQVASGLNQGTTFQFELGT
ncbi:MAG: HAMP domain-containing sensor histidine kinase [Pseudomonadota bacterium]|nr:HAMP domain-containing sensor histidine kinase [Pseudomonadota bacterium]